MIFSSNNYPIFQNVLYETPEKAINCKVADIEIVQDEQTGLIYNRKFNPKLMDYNEEYHNEQQFSDVFKKHLNDVKNIIERNFNKESILEIGCGDGYFLELLSNNGFDIEGMDPSYEGNNKNIKKEYYTENNNKKYNGIILRHVLEHLENPYNFLLNIKNINKDNGLVYIESPNLDYINDNCVFTNFFYEYVTYFRLSDFEGMFDSILESGTIFNDQYIYIVAKLDSLKKPVKRSNFSLNKNFFDKLNLYIEIIKSSNSKKVIWGCSSKGVIFSILLNNKNIKVDYFVDINPNKQKKYIPLISNENGYGQVHSYKDIEKELYNNSIIFIMNDNYKDEIINITNNKYKYVVI